MSIHVHFCCNDPGNGAFTGIVRGVQIEDDILYLTPHVYDEDSDDGVGQPLERHKDHIVLGGESFPIRGWSCHVGNWCWDMAHMAMADVVRLVTFLRSQEYAPGVQLFDCDYGECAVFDAWEKKQPITAEMLAEAMKPANP